MSAWYTPQAWNSRIAAPVECQNSSSRERTAMYSDNGDTAGMRTVMMSAVYVSPWRR